MSISRRTYNRLKKITGPEYISKAKEDLVCYSYDATGMKYLPDLIVFPENSDAVSNIMRIAHNEKIAVIPRGSGSGMSGGSLAVNGGIILCMSRFNAIKQVDAQNFTADVQPGVITGDFHKHVERLGLFYPPDPASSSFCSLGGNLSECAGGPRAVKYGVTKDYVLGITAVLPCGDIIKTGVRTAKGVAGYDLTKLIVGSEGTLAVITEMILKLLPLPDKVGTMMAIFGSMKDAAYAVSGIIKSGLIPRTVEYLDN
ncbi:MAG: FAD-binding protein, partial [bacterium]|nr:FAD-binding protein [bacterium]